ncbi:hypothetical protein A9W95_02880 [Mycobacterium sp. 1423905.2]|nr:hypothetical protein A9W95_02880 [Mycobacterium sp. 1423905.2]
MDVDDLVDVEAGHIGGEFWAGHDLPAELFGVNARWVADQGDKTIRTAASFGPYPVGGDPEGREGNQVASPVHSCIPLQGFW